jgi:DNA-binding beta-propeller fold protein YncE
MQGSLIVLDKNGQQVAQFANANLLNGPWDMTVHDAGNRGQIFVSNVLSGSISRFDFRLPAGGGFKVVSAVQIASGYTHMGDPAAFEIGPTGLAFDSHRNTLYVASTGDNAIYAIHNAAGLRRDNGTGTVIYQDNVHLHGPLGLAFAPGGNLITANGDAVNADPNNPSTLVEFTRKGRFIGQFSIDPTAGAAFGIATSDNGRQFAAVNDVTSAVTIWSVRR